MTRTETCRSADGPLAVTHRIRAPRRQLNHHINPQTSFSITPTNTHTMPPYAQDSQVWYNVSKALFVVGICTQVAFLLGVLSPFAAFNLFRASPSLGQTNLTPKASGGHTLRHVFHHGAGQPGPRARRLDVKADRIVAASAAGQYGPFSVKTAPVTIERPAIRTYSAQIPMSPMWIAENVP
jgi:lipase ATG15